MTQGIEVASRRVQAAALLLIACLAAGPVSTHVYWTLGGLYTNGVRDEVADTGTRVVAAVVVVLLVAAVLVVLARVGWWQQAFVSDRMIRFFAWALAAVFLLETLAAFTWSRGEELWWMYGPVSLVIAVVGGGRLGRRVAPPAPAAPDAALSLKETSWPRGLFPSQPRRRSSRQPETAQ